MRAPRLRHLLALALGATLLLACFAQAEIERKNHLQVSVQGSLSPRTLPRNGTSPVSVSLSSKISSTNGRQPPQLRQILIAINRHGRLDYAGLPACHESDIQPASSAAALSKCGDSLVGRGTFRAAVALPDQTPFPQSGELLAFNGVRKGRHVIFAHIYGTDPLPQSSLIVFQIGRASGTFGTTLKADLPRVAANWGYISGISMTLSRRYRYRGEPHSYLSAGCPAPQGTKVAPFPLSRSVFSFAGGTTIALTLVRSCRARG